MSPIFRPLGGSASAEAQPCRRRSAKPPAARILAALGILLSIAPARAQTLNCQPGAFRNTTECRAPGVVIQSQPGAFSGETVTTTRTPDGRTLSRCTTMPGALKGETRTVCQ